MAYVDKIFMHSGQLERQEMTVYIKLKPSGEVALKVPLPENYYKSLLALAQTAADHHEAQMRATILGEEQPQ